MDSNNILEYQNITKLFDSYFDYLIDNSIIKSLN